MKNSILLSLFIVLLSVFSTCNKKYDSTELILDLEQNELFQKLNPKQKKIILGKAKQQQTRLTQGYAACWVDGGEENLSRFLNEYESNFPFSLIPGNNKGGKLFEFDDSDRWERTATNGSGLSQGDPTTLTWSFVPDGTSIYGYAGESTSNSSLIAMLDGQYDPGSTGGSDLTQRVWFPLFVDIFDRWSELTGNSYVYEPNDDGSSMTAFSLPTGVLGVRGDLRIGGHSIDGSSGSNILAYNFFPDFGEMVIDTDNASYFGNTAGNSIRLRNTLSHEHGHGLGVSHSCPIHQTKLMEPFISTAFDGPQFDDILAATRGYGDKNENNNNTGSATDLGVVSEGSPITLEDVSIDDDADVDYLKFTVSSAASATISLSPVGSTYLAGPQNSNGSCSSGSSFNPMNQSDLHLELYQTNGTTLIASSDTSPAGGSENITDEDLINGAGTYFIKVGGANNAAQLYELTISITNNEILGCTDSEAHNFDPAANTDDGSCETCMDGVMNGDETNVDCGGSKCNPCVTGCMDPLACDYNSAANVAGLCDYSCYGCTDTLANNYDMTATRDDGMCTYDCTTSSTNIIDNSNVNSMIITTQDTLKTVGSLILPDSGTGIYHAKESIILSDFQVNLGGLLSVRIDSCH